MPIARCRQLNRRVKLLSKEAVFFVVSGAGDDAITASSGSDVFDYNFITDGNDAVTRFNKDKDKIDLSDLLQYSNGQDIAKFVAVSDDGTNTTINVDAHGRGNTSAATRDISITLNGVTGPTLADIECASIDFLTSCLSFVWPVSYV